MPKQKTHKGLAKRVTVSGSGKVRRKRAFGGHLMSTKSGNRCRRIRQSETIPGAMGRKVLRALGQ